MEFFAILLGGIFIQNFIFSRFLGICPFLGISQQVETATGMGLAVVFVMTVASGFTWLVQTYILNDGLVYLQTVAFILVIASLVQFVEMVIQKVSPTLYQALGVFLPLITTNCAVLGVAVINIRDEYSFIEAVVNGAAGGLGFLLAIVLMAGVRERLATANVPEAMKGFPVAFLSAGLMSIAFFGFQGLFQHLFIR